MSPIKKSDGSIIRTNNHVYFSSIERFRCALSGASIVKVGGLEHFSDGVNVRLIYGVHCSVYFRCNCRSHFAELQLLTIVL